MPVQDITANPQNYRNLVYGVIITVAVLYIGFGQFCVIAWGSTLDESPLITDKLPEGGVGWSIQILFALNLIFSFPLVLYPAHIIIENYLYSGWPKTKKRQWSKNLTRMLLVGFVVILTVLLKQKLDKFLSILGALTCTPIAFTFPAIFHYKACAETTCQKAIDLTLVVISIAALIFCTSLGVINWNSD